MSYFFLNTTKDLVPETIDGYLRYSQTPVARLDVGSPDINVIVRPDWTKEKADKQVAIISGGGSGHEPMHAGFVGEGMLTAAICGGLFASPSYEAVLSTILHVAGKAGVFVIVKAYTGDCLIFGLAVEKAKSLGIKVDMIIFSDDISIPDHPRPRGLAGTILMHKICGYYSQQRKSLEDIKKVADLVMSSISTIGLSITSCRTPTSTSENRIQPGHAELGLGIHGEAGIEIIDTQNVDKIVDMMVQKLKNFRKGPIAILLNNLGGVSELEMGIICSTLLKREDIEPRLLIGPASLCTSLDMKGFSVTFLELKANFETALKAQVITHAWRQPVDIHPPLSIRARNQIGKKTYSSSKNEKIVKIICDVLISSEQKLNELDQFTGDGDTGLTFAAGARSILDHLQKNDLPLNDLPSLFECIADILDISMGGSSGALLSILLLQTSAALRAISSSAGEGENNGEICSGLSGALEMGVKKMMELGGAKIGSRTMVDALLPAAQALSSGVAAAAEAAEKGAESTKDMEKALAGRSTYLSSESLKGHADAGACAVAIVFRALADTL